jgi:HlyD family secretion protein
MSPKILWSKIRPHESLLLALLTAALVVVAFVPRLVMGPQVPVALVAQRDVVQTVVASGHVETPHRVDIGVQIVGTVVQVPVSEGQSVAQDQALIVLDDAELRATLDQALVNVAQAQMRLRQMREVQEPVALQAARQAQINLDNARTQLTRQQDLFGQGFVGQAALDDARRNVDLADAQWRSANEQLKTVRPAGSDHALAEAALSQARASADVARARLSYATIRAPLAGVLINRSVERGDVVQPGKSLMVLSPAGETQLVVQIDEKNIGLLTLGQSAIASADAYAQQTFGAELVYVNPGVDAQRGSVEVKLRVPVPPTYLKQDMTVSVDIEVARRVRAIVVPSDAVHDASSANPWVLVVDSGRARRQTVALGLRAGGVCEVLQGLKAGDRVVPAAAVDVGDGTRLRAVVSS